MSFAALPDELIARAVAGDARAAGQIVAVAVEQLLPLARRRLGVRLQARIDPEDVLQSVFRSFFTRLRDGDLECHGGERLWRLLAVITLRKCANRRAHANAACRSVEAEVPWMADTPSREVGPEEAATLADLLAHLQRRLPPLFRSIVEKTLQGETAETISGALSCPLRTVRRVRERFHADLLLQLEES
ncbi:MAG: ECF-type sigma factor [Gemmataceae bacterium]